MPLEHDRRAIICFDHRPKVRSKRPVVASAWVVSAAEASVDLALAPTFCDIEVLLPIAAETNRPSLRIGEADSVEGLKPHRGHSDIRARPVQSAVPSPRTAA